MKSISLDRLQQILAEKKKVLVSYSGGVDSTVLAVVSRQVLGPDSRCALLHSPLIPRRTFKNALSRARALGLDCDVIPFPILDYKRFVENREDRCYICKKVSSHILKDRASEFGKACVIDGVQLSDMNGYRPGLAACDEERIVHPLSEAGMTKEDVRNTARGYGFDFWDNPSSACLASRIPYGEKITVERLEMIEKAEDILQDLGFHQVRVRTHGTIARIEVLPDQFGRLLTIRETVTSAFERIGYDYVTLDLEGFRSGSMDKGIDRFRSPGT
jgi:uncharacterized protein